MRDVIVVGAGGGGAVVAKELAQRGLDVLLLEAGPRWAHTEKQWSHHEAKANNPASGYFRFGPSDLKKGPWRRDLPQYCYLWQTGGVGGSTVHFFGNCPRAPRGVFADGSGDYDHAPLPVRLRGAPCRTTSGSSTRCPSRPRRWGRRRRSSCAARRGWGSRCRRGKDISRDACRPQENAILQPRGTAGKVKNPKYPRRAGLHVLRALPRGLHRAEGRAAEPAREALDRHELRADGADGGPVGEGRQGASSSRTPSSLSVARRGGARASPGARREPGEETVRAGARRRARRRLRRDAATLAAAAACRTRTTRSAAG